MNIREMQIEVRQSTQLIASNRNRKLFDEEIDFVLNKMQKRFIQSRLRKNPNGSFTVDQSELDSIRTLIVQRTQPAYVDQQPIAGRYYAYLPGDYAYLLNDASYITNLCGATAPEPAVKSLHIQWLKQPWSTKVSTPFYVTYSLTSSVASITIPTDLSPYNAWAGLASKEDLSFLVPFVLDSLHKQRTATTDVYFESMGNKYKPGFFALVNTFAAPSGGSITIDGTSSAFTASGTETVLQHASTSTTILTGNRLLSSEIVHDMIGTAYYKPSYESPISCLEGGLLNIYTDKNSTVSSCLFTYIRKPRPLSIALGSDCELAEEYHQTICDLASAYIKNRLENDKGASMVEHDIEKQVIL